VRLIAACFAAGIALQVSAADDRACRSKPPATTDTRLRVQATPYEKIKPADLAAVYRKAYVEAGFKFKGRSRIDNYGGFRLAFELEVPGFNRKGAGTIVFGVKVAPDGTCAPCEVHRETMGIPWRFDKNYDAEKQWKADQFVFAADARANARIKEKLGKSLGSLLDQTPAPASDEPC
jgi:hypothetical protein